MQGKIYSDVNFLSVFNINLPALYLRLNFATPREDWQRSLMVKQRVSLPNSVVDLKLCLFVLTIFHNCIFTLQTPVVGLKFGLIT